MVDHRDVTLQAVKQRYADEQCYKVSEIEVRNFPSYMYMRLKNIFQICKVIYFCRLQKTKNSISVWTFSWQFIIMIFFLTKINWFTVYRSGLI